MSGGPRAPDRRLLLPRLHLRGALAPGGRGDACDVARCGEGKDFSLVYKRADDVGPGCCVVTHRGDLLHRVVGPAHDEAAHASNAVGDVGNVVGMVLDFPDQSCVPRTGPARP